MSGGHASQSVVCRMAPVHHEIKYKRQAFRNFYGSLTLLLQPSTCSVDVSCWVDIDLFTCCWTYMVNFMRCKLHTSSNYHCCLTNCPNYSGLHQQQWFICSQIYSLSPAQLLPDPHGACWGASTEAGGSASRLAHSRGWPGGAGCLLLSMSISLQEEEDNFFIA